MQNVKIFVSIKPHGYSSTSSPLGFGVICKLKLQKFITNSNTCNPKSQIKYAVSACEVRLKLYRGQRDLPSAGKYGRYNRRI